MDTPKPTKTDQNQANQGAVYDLDLSADFDLELLDWPDLELLDWPDLDLGGWGLEET